MPRLSTAQKYAIMWLKQQNQTDENIASELNITEKQVANHLSKNKKNLPENSSDKNTNTTITSKDMMIRATSVKGDKNVAIMTKEASEMNDAFKKNQTETSHNPSKKSAIHKIS
jgi:predicted transcriptional regulator